MSKFLGNLLTIFESQGFATFVFMVLCILGLLAVGYGTAQLYVAIEKAIASRRNRFTDEHQLILSLFIRKDVKSSDFWVYYECLLPDKSSPNGMAWSRPKPNSREYCKRALILAARHQAIDNDQGRG